MGKVIPEFAKGWPGAVSRSADEIIVSLKNTGETDIPFGAPVFLDGAGKGVVGFETGGSQTFESFVGFAVRIADRTPDTYPRGQDLSPAAGNQQAAWPAGDVAEVLVRGTVVVPAQNGFLRGGRVYLRRSDGQLVPSAGSEGSTLLLENARVRTPATSASPCAEILLTARNTQ